MHISTSVTFPLSQGRRFKRISVFSRRRSPLHLFAIVSMPGYRFYRYGRIDNQPSLDKRPRPQEDEMSSLIENFDSLARLLLEALLNTLWQGMLIAVLVWLLLRLVNRVSATTRHAVWLVTLLTIGALPLLAVVANRNDPATNPSACQDGVIESRRSDRDAPRHARSESSRRSVFAR